jgi:hypothetical protein
MPPRRGTERFQAKWLPVRVKKTRQIKNLESRFDSIEAGVSACEALRRARGLARCDPEYFARQFSEGGQRNDWMARALARALPSVN